MYLLQHCTNQRLVQPEEITKLEDLRNLIITLSEHLAIDFPANGVRSYGYIGEQFTPRERLLSLILCFNLLHRPEDWVHNDDLVDAIFPLPDGRDDCQPHNPKHAVEQIVSQVRQKLGEELRHPSILRCARHLGYRLYAAPGYGYAITCVLNET